MIEFDQEVKKQESPTVSIKVVGVGGAGGNTVNSIIDSGYNFIECIAVNTDAQALINSKADIKIQLGIKSTKGMGTGANPELGKRAAQEDISKVMDELEGSDIVFLAGGMGGGTGSGALPVIARALRESGILSIAVVTKPFEFEGKKRARVAQEAIELLKKEVDTLLIIPNQKLLDVTDKNISMIDAFALINNVLGQSVKGISEIITCPGHINVDFADVKAIMKDTGIAVMGSGTATGPDRAALAAMQAISSPLLENMSIEGATGVLLNITGGKSLGLHEIGAAASIIYEQVNENANIILGTVTDESMDQEVTVTIIATGFGNKIQENKSCSENTTCFENTFCDVQLKATTVVLDADKEKEIDLSKVSQEIITKKEGVVFEKEFEGQELEKSLDEKNIVEKVAISEAIAIERCNDQKIFYAKEDVLKECDGKKESDYSVLNDSIDLNDLDVPSFMRKSI